MLATCILSRVCRVEYLADLSDDERAFGNYAGGRYAWHLTDIQALPEPMPATGKLGLWNWDEL